MELSIQERLKDLRVERGLTLEQLAEQTHLSKSALGSYEAEDFKDISHYALIKLAKFYGVTSDYLLGLSETKNHPNADLADLRLSKRTKYRRPHRVSYEGRTKGGDKVSFGEFGLVATEGAWITSRQIEAARIAINRYMNRGGKVWIRIFPHLAKTKKPLEVRMGSGKGSPEEWVAVVKTGRVLFEVAGLDEATLREALRLASHKLPIKCKIIGKGE